MPGRTLKPVFRAGRRVILLSRPIGTPARRIYDASNVAAGARTNRTSPPKSCLMRQAASQGSRGYDMYGFSKEKVIADIVAHYDRFLHFVALRP